MKQPKSPQNEGVDPLTKGDKLHPVTNTKNDSEKLAEQELAEPTKSKKTTKDNTDSDENKEQTTK